MIDPESADRIGPFWFIFPSVNWTRHRGIPIGARSLCSGRNYGERYGRIVITPTLFYNRNLRECVRLVYRVIVRCVALSGLWVVGGGGGGSEWLSAPGSTITVLVLVNQLLYIRYYTLEYR